MNPALEFLLGRIYDGALAPDHRADLERSGLTPETIAANYFRSVPPAMPGRLLGFDVPVRSMMLLPFRAPAGGFMDFVRVKLFPALADADRHTTKYLQPRGSTPRLYFPAPTLRDGLADPARTLWCVEGEKKSLAVAQLGYCAVGFLGAEGWHVKDSATLLPDFDACRLRNRIVELLPDGDYRSNLHVKRAMHRFATALAARGARPRVRLLPRELPR
jgi:uncharacterized protein DUF3854